MATMDWKEAILAWRQLPEQVKHAIRWHRIPRNVSQSMAFEQEPVEQEMLEAAHASQPMPPVTSKHG